MAAAVPHYAELARPYIEAYGYPVLFFGVLVESFGIPAPGQSLIMLGALLAARGQLDIVALLALAWSAAVIGDNLGYAIGRFGGRRLIARYGRYVGIRERHLEHAEGFFRRYGGAVVVFARFLEVLRQLNGVVAGAAGMPWWNFLAFNAAGAALWVGLWGYGVYRLGEHADRPWFAFKRAEPYALGLLGLLLVVALLGWALTRGRSVR